MIKQLTIAFIMVTTSTSFPHRHSQSRNNIPDLSYKKFHLRDEIHGTQYLKVEHGTNFLNLVQNSEHFDPEESSEKSRMSDITWFTGNFFTGLMDFSAISFQVKIKVAESQKVFYFDSNLKKKMSNHNPGHLFFRWIVLRIVIWHLFWRFEPNV